MSEKSKVNRKKRDEQQEKQANKVVIGLFGALVFLGLCFLVYSLIISA